MLRRRPMDRLVVGDVGYGKTEVALRAAFKAVQDGKQVAVLVPTTVLAQQHLITFQRRLAAFPVERSRCSAASCRRRSRSASSRASPRAASTSSSARIGSCRRTSAFADLGLLVVDEEQRFGVSHKERIKAMRREVDVLTLSATPIPRTLHLSLVGIRDLSVIETPPEARLPIQTRIAEDDDGLVRDAIRRELDRGGQVFYVHNRVETIEAAAERVRRLVPGARVAIGHGQMAEGMLERVMLDFSDGRFDVLVCTTIIESGLDIPNANTIIIVRADTFGLAQLYQLRGRVGRSDRRAHAYLLHRRGMPLTPIARKRLHAIFSASDLGAGYQIALSDLEIRGAGNILGAEQHGFMAAVGFEMYTRMLAEAVDALRGRRAAAGALTGAARPAGIRLPARRLHRGLGREARGVPALRQAPLGGRRGCAARRPGRPLRAGSATRRGALHGGAGSPGGRGGRRPRGTRGGAAGHPEVDAHARSARGEREPPGRGPAAGHRLEPGPNPGRSGT